MDNKTGKRRLIYPRSLSRLVVFHCVALTCLFAGQIAKSDDSNGLSINSGIAVSQFYRVNVSSRPRLGFIVNPENVTATGENFEFCDGERIDVKLLELVAVTETCASNRVNLFDLSAFLAKPEGALIYDENFTYIGELVAASFLDAFGSKGEFMINLNPVVYNLAPSTRVIDFERRYLDVQLGEDGNFTVVVRNAAEVEGLNWNF